MCATRIPVKIIDLLRRHPEPVISKRRRAKDLNHSKMNFFSKLFHRKNKTSANFDGIVAAKVLEVQKHPNADRLRVVKVDVGDKIIEPIVCGAFNFGVGDVVALALPGAKIMQDIHSPEHKPFILEKAKIRGIESQGMICAAFELGLSNEPGQGIMVLKNDISPGSQFKAKMIK
jgi:tRNA-binding EMAP/Myf-like protein